MSAEYIYVVSDYFGTGEGVTKALLVTRAYPSRNDLDENHEPLYGKHCIAMNQFHEIFGPFLSYGAEVISKEDFLKRYEQFIPDYTKRVINGEVDTPGNFKWFGEMHINYS